MSKYFLLILFLFQTSDVSGSAAMNMDTGISYTSTSKRLRVNGPSQATDRNGQATGDNLSRSAHRGMFYNSPRPNTS